MPGMRRNGVLKKSAHFMGCLIFWGLVGLNASAETVLIAYSGGSKEVRQFSVVDGVWMYEKVFASGSYEGKALTPSGVASDGRHVYVSDISARRILAFETNGVFAGTVTNFASTCTPECVLAAPNGYLYMSDAFGSAGDRIYRFDLDTWQGGEFIAATGWGSAFNNPRGLAVDENGMLFVADRNANAVRRFNSMDGAYSNTLATLTEPNGLAYDFVSRRVVCAARQGSLGCLAEIDSDGTVVLRHSDSVTSFRIGVVTIGEDAYYSSFNENKVFRVRPDGTRTVVVDVQPDVNQPMYMTVVPDHPLTPENGLTAHWRFHETVNAPLLASCIGPAGYREVEAQGYLQSGASGVEGGALWFNAYSSGLIRDSKSLISATNDFSVFLWAGAPAEGGEQRHVLSKNGGQPGRCELGYDFDGGSARKLFWWHVDGPTLISTNDARDGTWHHIGVIRRGDQMELWLDGVMETSAVTTASIDQTVDWRLGRAVSPNFYLKAGAFMDDVRVYDRALSGGDVSALYTTSPSTLPVPVRPALPVPDLTVAESDLAAVAVGHQPRIAEPVGSPSLLMMSGGVVLAAYDVCGGSGLTRVCRSTDSGITWTQIAELIGLVHASLFEDGGALYLLGSSGVLGSVRIHRSTDGGVTWSAGTTLSPSAFFHMAAGPVVVHDGRVWKATEDQTGEGWRPEQARARMISALAGGDLMDAANWTVSDPLSRSGWVANRRLTGWLDGNAVVDKTGGLVSLMSVRQNRGGMAEMAAYVPVVASGPAPVFNLDTGFVMLPGAAKPFMVRYDDVSGLYWTLTSAVSPSENQFGKELPENVCHRLAVYSSHNLRDWCLRNVLLERAEYGKDGFLQASFVVSGNDLVVLFAAAYADGLSGPRSVTEPNMVLVKRIAGFRSLPVDEGDARVLVADTGLNRVMRYSLNSLGQWCDDNVFADGLSAPYGLALSRDTVYVAERVAGGRLLAYTLKGRLLRTVTTFAPDSTPGALEAAPDGMLFVSLVSSVNGDKVVKVNPADGMASVFVDTTGWGGTLVDPRGLSCDGAGNLYVATQFETGNTVGYFRKFSTAGILLETSRMHDQPRGVFYDASVPRIIGSVYGSCDVLSLPLPLGDAYAKIGDYNIWTKFYDISSVDGRICFTDFDYGMVHIVRSTLTAQGTIAAGLKNPAELLLIPEGAEAWPDVASGTLISLK